MSAWNTETNNLQCFVNNGITESLNLGVGQEQSHDKCPTFIFKEICYPIFTYWCDLEENITSLMANSSNFANSVEMLLLEA